ncbi:RelA/SpoT family protein [Filifactor villosus]|uniref:GTP diphosphokinase n=1 Tax=Filifactor villosus TaxID=29374 RepID=A0ABV9QLP2_9FIRM
MLENLLQLICEYNPDANLDVIIKAFRLAERQHRGIKRKSGEEYIIHPVEVAKILVEMRMDTDTVAAGLLHDVLEDTSTTYEEMKREFGQTIADLVDGVTKLGTIKYKKNPEGEDGEDEASAANTKKPRDLEEDDDKKDKKDKNDRETEAENIRKMFLAMGKDIRVILIKLADRLHNMRTMKYMPPEKAKKKSEETLDIYAPIANRLGIFHIKWEMEDLALRYTDPEMYQELIEKVAKKRQEREAYISEVKEILTKKLEENGLKFEITGRAKHFYSIYRKMKHQGKDFDEIYDLTAIRVLVETVPDCYSVLGYVHTLWKPIQKRMKDYISSPKSNMYQSLHTTVVGMDGEPLEIQIRTWDMHRTAEFGIAAHWKYKESFRAKGSADEEMEKELSWLRQMTEWQKEVSDPEEFLNSTRRELFANEVFVYSPKQEVMEFPRGACPLDFAYKVHSEVGHKCVGARVNGKMVPIDYELKTGDIVEIITSGHSQGPSLDWLKLVKTSGARTKIRQWFKKEKREENIEKGRELLEKHVKNSGYPLDKFLKTRALTQVAKSFQQEDIESLYATLGYGGLLTHQVVPRLKEIYEAENKEILEKKAAEERAKEAKKAGERSKLVTRGAKKTRPDTAIHVKGIENILIRMAKCCNPVPGDEIVGYITKGRGVSIHRTDCDNIEHDPDKQDKRVEVYWNEKVLKEKAFETEVRIIAYDRKNLFNDLTIVLANEKIDINGINAKTNSDGIAIMSFLIEVSSVEVLRSIMNKLKQVEGVREVTRGK